MHALMIELERVRQARCSAHQRAAELTSDLAWYADFDLDQEHTRLLDLRRDLEVNQQSRHALAQQQHALRERYETAQIVYRDARFFSKARSDASAMVKELKATLAEVEQKIDSLLKEASAFEPVAARLEVDLKRYRYLDPLQASAERDARLVEVARLDQEIAPLQARQDRLNAQISEVVQVLNAARAEYGVNTRRIALAKDFEAKLSRAQTKYDRAMVHQECEQKLGQGNPRSVLSKATDANRQIERRITKLQHEVNERTAWATMDIRTLYIDGSNLCNADGRFEGLAILDALVPQLIKACNVHVSFDPGIVAKLQVSKAQISDRFPLGVSVEFIPRGFQADRFLLEAAADDQTAFVLSADKFEEYIGHQVVKSKRVIRPVFAHGVVHVQQLDIRVRWRPAAH